MNLDAIDIQESGYLVNTSLSSPTNLAATTENSKVKLIWSAINEATSYNLKRSTTSGGPYETITTGSAITFIDESAINDTTYYYVVSAVNSEGKSINSNEVSATPTLETAPPDHTGNTATLILTMTNGGIKEYHISLTELDDFLT